MAAINGLKCSCIECKNKFELEKINLVDRQIKINDEEIHLTILICPFCFKEYIVQIDNNLTLDLLKQQIKINTTLAKKKLNNKKTDKWEKRLKEASALLIKFRKELKDKYNNSVYYFQNENKKIVFNEPVVSFG